VIIPETSSAALPQFEMISGTTFSFTLPLDGGDWKPAEWLEQAS
jgi:hypothetical protein